MTTRAADLFVQSARGLPLALVQIKNQEDLTLDIELREMLFNYYGLVNSSVPYFLLFSQENGLLWDLRKHRHSKIMPDHMFPMDEVVKRYWSKLQPGKRLRGNEVKLVLFQWLSDIANGMIQPLHEPEITLRKTPFWHDLQGATVRLEEPV